MGKVAIIGVPLDLGGNRRGVDMGPSALRLTHLATRIKLLGYDVLDTGDIDVPLPEEAHIGDLKKNPSPIFFAEYLSAPGKLGGDLRSGPVPRLGDRGTTASRYPGNLPAALSLHDQAH